METGYDVEDWIQLAEDRVYWWLLCAWYWTLLLLNNEQSFDGGVHCLLEGSLFKEFVRTTYMKIRKKYIFGRIRYWELLLSVRRYIDL